jgi:hypothetical protein
VDNTVISNDNPTPCLGRTVPKSRSQSQLQNNTTFKSCDMNTHRSINRNKSYNNRGGNYDVCNNCNNHDKHSDKHRYKEKDKQIKFDHNISNTDHSKYKQCDTCNLPKKM